MTQGHVVASFPERRRIRLYLLHQPRVSQKLLSRRAVHRIKAQEFGHEVRYAFHVHRTQYTSCIKKTLLERFADEAFEFLWFT
jgi:hypothetical protein